MKNYKIDFHSFFNQLIDNLLKGNYKVSLKQNSVSVQRGRQAKN